MKAFLSVMLFSLALVAMAQNPTADKITSLPLWSGSLGNQYSGYITLTDGSQQRNLHYWFVEAATNPAGAPVVLWLNGGPGCSSLDGFFYEMGPIHFAQNSTLGLVPNPYAWTAIANMIFLEAPAGVGFSYVDGTVPTYNDTGVANDNYQALLKWFAAYPQYKSNDFWITGESYAGIYVPSLANLVQRGVLSKEFPAPFKGVMVGNGVTNADGDNDLNDPIAFMVGHALISTSLYGAIVKACPDPNNPNQKCEDLIGQALNSLNNIDIYDIYSDCFHQRSSDGSPPCIDSNYARQYLNRPDVQTALHVKKTKWEICNFNINGGYDRTEDSMVPIYKFLLANKVKVLIYSGDTDFAVPYTGSEFWTSSMGLTVTGTAWRQWSFKDALGNQVAGYVTDYSEGLTFATVKGSGHMVPQFKPIPALVMFQKTLTGQKL
jgi:carboxypeptidase C (cathepsin A)